MLWDGGWWWLAQLGGAAALVRVVGPSSRDAVHLFARGSQLHAVKAFVPIVYALIKVYFASCLFVNIF